jgi:hypothetical protein
MGDQTPAAAGYSPIRAEVIERAGLHLVRVACLTDPAAASVSIRRTLRGL